MASTIEVGQWYDRSVTLAVLQVASQKWGAITVTGPPAYKRMCVDLAAQHGIKLVNPELQGSLQQAREQLDDRARERQLTLSRRSGGGRGGRGRSIEIGGIDDDW